MPLSHMPAVSMAKPVIGEEEITEVVAVLRSGLLSEGDVVAQFEGEFATFIGTRHAVAVNSGTAALHLALLARSVGPGDEVITSPFTFVATANAILLTGARPVFADIEYDTFNMDPEEVIRRISPRTKALIPVHLYGQPCNMLALTNMAEHYGIALIEDACQAHGAEYMGKKVGSFGVGCFSFYPTKNMSTGEGGMITTDDDDVAARVRIMRNHGQTRRYYHESLGFNYRMTNLGGALGRCQLRRLPQFNEGRNRNAEILTGHLKDICGLVTPTTRYGSLNVFHQYTIRLTDRFPMARDEFRQELQENGISTEVYYPLPVHMQPLYRDLGCAGDLPVSEEASRQVVSLPIHPSLCEHEVHYVAECIERAARS